MRDKKLPSAVRRREQRCERLGTLTHAAFEGDGFAGHELEVRGSQLDAHMANFHLGIAVVTHRGHLDIRLERLGICLLEVLQLRRPCQRADDVDVDAVLAPFGGGNAGQAANAFLCRGIRALPIVAEQTRAGS